MATLKFRSQHIIRHHDSLAAEPHLPSLQGLLWESVGGAHDWSLPTSRAVRLIRSAAGPRLAFSALSALAALPASPPAWLALWVASIVVWEVFARPTLEDTFVDGDDSEAMKRLAAIHLAGSLIYVAFPFLVWSPQQPIGMVVAVAWTCASANHAFVYFASSRILLLAAIVPLSLAGLAAPLFGGGGTFTLLSCVASVALVGLIMASAVIGRDRRVLLRALSEEQTARTAADSANAMKSRFLAMVSHELRTPLNAIIGYAELIEESGQPEAASDASKIRASARGLLAQLNTILEASKLEAGDDESGLEPCNIAELLRDVWRAAQAQAAASGNRNALHYRVPDLGVARLSPKPLSRCLGLLLSNADKFTSGGAITLAAERRRNGAADYVTISVIDSGVGISADLHDRIFEPFFQADSSAARRYEGAGLGLWHARLIARSMGGDIICQSTPGVGSTFSIQIPLSV